MDFATMIQTWIKALSSPNDQTYEELRVLPEATLSNALIWRVVAAVVVAILSYLAAMMGMSAMNQILQMMQSQGNLPPEAQEMLQMLSSGGMMGGMMGVGALGTLIMAPVGLLFSSGLYHLMSSMLGGKGDYGSFAFLNSAIWSPISVVSAGLGLVPILGGCIGFILLIYGFVLTHYGVKANYGLTTGKAIMVVATPVILVILLFFCLFALAVGMAASLQGIQP